MPISCRPLWKLLTLVCLIAAGAALRAAPIISEFMAVNNSSITDQDGDNAPWIEIYNPDPTTDSLSGWYLTDSATALTRWKIPAVSLLPGAYLIIFASAKNYTLTNGPLATNFTLAKSGGYLALVESDGKTVASAYTYPAQNPNYSYGLTQPTSAGEVPQVGYFLVATPGAPNGGQTNILLTDQVTLSNPGGIFTGGTTVTLTGATGAEKIRYVLASPSSAGDAILPPTAASPLYTGPLTISSTQLLIAAVFSADDSQTGLPATGMYIQLDNTSANRLDTFSSNLPLVVYDDNGFGLIPNNLTFYPGWVGAFEPSSKGVTTLTAKPQFFTPATWKDHGFSSATWPKQSYDLSLSDDLGNSRNEAFFGLDSDHSWDSISPWSVDRTFLHNAFVYSLGRSLGYWTPQEKFSEMFIHAAGGPLDYTSYSGITNITDKIKVSTSRVNIYALSPGDVAAPNVTGGYILRIDHPETTVTDYTWTTTAGVTLMIDTPKLDVVVQPQINYITNYVREMENAMVADQASGYATHTYANYLDVPSWVDYHLMQTFVQNDDGLLFSEYFTKDINGLIKAGPFWDFDRSMGSADGRDANPFQWNPYNDQDFWNIGWWSYLTHDPDFMQAWIDRWQSLRLTTLSTKSIVALVNSLAAQMGTAAPARDAARWPDDASRFPGGWTGEVNNWSSWLSSRGTWIDQQFVSAPAVNVLESGIVLVPPAGAQIVYTLDGSDPRASGGGLTAAALMGSGVVRLPAGQTFLARSYNASQAKNYPGSAWSSPVNASTSPASGLPGNFINLSCQTMVGSGSSSLVEGFAISGPAGTQKQMLVRGVGPALATFGVTGALAQPVLTLYNSNGGTMASDTGWSNDANAAAIQAAAAATGAFALPAGSADSALLVSVSPGVYTLQVAAPGSNSGIALAEAYQTVQDAASLINVSTRAVVGGAAGPLITGFVIGNGSAKILVRASGPALLGFGLTGTLTQPQLAVYDSNSQLIASDAGWGNSGNPTAIAAAAASVGAFAFASGSADCALLLTLPAGSYTAQITSGDGTVGDALAECYLVP